MSSILTNPGATIALRTLHDNSQSLSALRLSLASGKAVANARDNAAVWSISKTISSDVTGYKQIAQSLAVGQSTLAVGRAGAETITDLLGDVKELVISAQAQNADRAKIQARIDGLKTQISGVATAANFNGVSLLSNRDRDGSTGTFSVLSMIDRNASGVSTSDITLRKQDLGLQTHAIAATGGTVSLVGTGFLLNGASADMDLSAQQVETGKAFSLQIYAIDLDEDKYPVSSMNTAAVALATQAEIADGPIGYVARAGDSMHDVLAALVSGFDVYAGSLGIDAETLSVTQDGTTLQARSQKSSWFEGVIVSVMTVSADADSTIGGGLETLGALDVTSDDGALKAMHQIEAALDTATGAASQIGSDQRRMSTQQGFVDRMSDRLQSGIGILTDLDMAESAARLQALQVQQSLSQQALSIANTAPLAVLELLR